MINFLKYRRLYLIISLLVLVPGVFSLVVWGLKPSIDFVGGTEIEIQKRGNWDTEKLKSSLANEEIPVLSIHEEADLITIRSKPIERELWINATANLDATPSALLTELRFETVGPVIGAELLQKTIIAALVAVSGILLYVAWAFKDMKYGISAIVALFHDVLVVMGVFSLLGHFYNVEVDVLFVTAVLTTMSFSVHDTIVVFDRIRESLRRNNLPFESTVNKALTDTMSRSVNNSMTIAFMLLALVLLGGETIKWFSVALLIGTISGTYSSPFVATQLLYILLRKKT